MGKCARNYDERIGRADQETELFQCANFCAQFGDCVAQLAFARRCGGRKRILVFGAFQSLFSRAEVRVGRICFLLPTIAGGRLEIRRRAGTSRQPVGIGAVGVYIHVRLKQKRFSMGLGMLKLQNGLAIEKVMPGQEQIETAKVFAQHSHLRVVKLRKKGRNWIGGQHRRQTGQQRW